MPCTDKTPVKRKKDAPHKQGHPKSYAAKNLEAVFGGNGELLAAMTTTCGKHLASTGCRHTLTETVLVDPLAAGWLESPFHI